MEQFDLAISFLWEFDLEFISLTEKIFQRNGYSTYIITEHNLDETVYNLRSRELSFRSYLDRASDENQRFRQLNKILRRKNCWLINDYKIVERAANKARMHSKLVKKNLPIPKTYLLPEYGWDYSSIISEEDIYKLGIPFVIKPGVFSGGGQGVITNGVSIESIQHERKNNPTEPYLVQQKITARKFGNRKAWFRIYWFFDHAVPVWWDDETHIYRLMKAEELRLLNLAPLIKITSRLARLSHVDYFSAEVAVTQNHHFYLIDYINDQCDFRLKSKHKDGVPDKIVREFIETMMRKIEAL